MNWSGKENGELLRLAQDNGFDVVITNDRGLEYEQNVDQLPVSVVVLLTKNNTIEAIRPICDALLESLAQIQPCKFAKVP